MTDRYNPNYAPVCATNFVVFHGPNIYEPWEEHLWHKPCDQAGHPKGCCMFKHTSSFQCPVQPYMDVRCVAPEAHAPHDASFQVRVWQHPRLVNQQVTTLFGVCMPNRYCDQQQHVVIPGCPESVLTDDMLVCDLVLAPAVAACDLAHEYRAALKRWLPHRWDPQKGSVVVNLDALHEVGPQQAPPFWGKASRGAYMAAFKERCMALFHSSPRPDGPPQQDHVAQRKPRKLRRK